MDTMMSDIRFALRSLGKSKLFTAVALLSLTLGIGVNVTVFSFINSLAFKPLPYPDANRLADVSEWSATKLCAGCGVGTSYPGYVDFRNRTRSFSAMGAYFERPFNVSGTETAERVGGGVVSAGTFDLLGVTPALGRGFTASDDRVGAPSVVLLSNSLWVNRYGADRRIIGQTIRINGIPARVIGVMPPRFEFPEFAKLWIPLAPYAAHDTSRTSREIGVVARLRDGVTMAQANAEVAAVARTIETEHPEQREWTARATPFRGNFDAMPPAMSVAMLGAVSFVLLIVCANLAGLLLARGARRRREIAIRLALGAGRGRIVRHLLMETVLLSCAGGALGLLLTAWAVDIIASQLGAQAPFYVTFGIDATTLAYCLIVSIATGILFGLLPSLRSSRTDVHTVLKDSDSFPAKSRLRGIFVIAEIALAMVLLAGAGELMKSFLRISAPAGAAADRNLLTGNVEFLDGKYRDGAAIRVGLDAIVDRLRAAPGVKAVAANRNEFIAGFGASEVTIRVDGLAQIPAGASPRFYGVVTPDFFSVMKLPIVVGRGFNSLDGPGSPPVTVINEQMARALWPNESAIGRRVKLGAADSLPWVTVVGVVANDGPPGRSRSYAYVPADQAPGISAQLLIRGDRAPAALVPAVRSAVREIDPDLPVLNLQSAYEEHRRNYWPYEMYALAMSAFAAFAVLLAGVGLYGVIAYNTSQRTREIGVRIALGAETRHVVRMVAQQGGRLVLLGIVVGTAGCVVLLRVLTSALFGASPVDVPVFAAVASLLAAIAMVAVWLPARRAARIDPLEALRAE